MGDWHRDAVKLVSCWAVRPLDVLQALNEHHPRIVHFSGHGSDQDEIVFQDNNGATKLVSKEAIVQTMAAASGESKTRELFLADGVDSDQLILVKPPDA
jgi:hypothetical protein